MALDEGSKGINEQASYAASKLQQLYERLEYKRQALGSIQNAPRPDKKVLCPFQLNSPDQFFIQTGLISRKHRYCIFLMY